MKEMRAEEEKKLNVGSLLKKELSQKKKKPKRR